MTNGVRVPALLLTAVWLALALPTPARADPITLIVAITQATSLAAAATLIVNAGFMMAANWAAGKLLGRNKASVQERQASVLSLSLGETPREAIIGEACTGGSLVDAFNHGGRYGTDWVTRCVAIADHAVDGVVGYYVDDVFYAFEGNGLQAGFSNCLDMEFVNATSGGAPPPARFLAASGGTWTTDDRMVGVTHVWLSYYYDDKVWPQGHPQFRFVLRGLRAYDPRKDAALGYGGPNPHVWSDRSTHEFTRNAALLRYAFTRGIYAEGHQGEAAYLLIGRGLSAEEAPPERIIAAANLCGELVGEKIRYAADGVLQAADDFIVVEEMFAAAMAGTIVQHEGGVEIEPGQAKAAVLTITDDDLVIGEPRSFSDFLPDNDGGRINSVIPRYVDPAQNWKDHAGPIRRDLADIAEDGGPREATLPLLLVTDGDQADRCAEIMRRLSRLENRASNVLPPEFAMLEEGDWIDWQSDRYHGGATVRYRIEGWALDEKWRMRLTLREIAAAVYEDVAAPGDESDPPVTPATPGAVDLEGVTVTAFNLQGQPGIRFTWDTPVDAAVLGIRAEVRLRGAAEVAASPAADPGDGMLVVTNGVTGGVVMEGRLVPLVIPSRVAVASPWVAVTIPTSPTVRDGIDRDLDVLLNRTAATVAEEDRREADAADARDRFDVLGEVSPISRQATLRGEDIFIGGGMSLEDVDYRVGNGLDFLGDVARPLPVGIANGSNLLRRTSGGLFTGDLTATFGATWGVNLGSVPTPLTDGRVGAGLDASGDVARPLTVPVADSSNILRRASGGLFTGDLAATLGASWGGNLTGRPTELTDGRVSAGLASNGDVARNLPSGVLSGSNVLTRAGGGGVFTGDLAATAGAIWGVNIGSIPTPLTDGRVGAGLDASGDLARPIPVSVLNSSGVLRRAGGGSFTGALDATNDATVTALASDLASGAVVPAEAGGISGQGALATLDNVTVGDQTAYTEGSITIPTGAGSQAIAQSVTVMAKAGVSISLTFNCVLQFTDTTTFYVNAVVKRGSVTVWGPRAMAQGMMVATGNFAVTRDASITVVDTPQADGLVTYEVILIRISTPSGGRSIVNRTLIAHQVGTEVKRYVVTKSDGIILRSGWSALPEDQIGSDGTYAYEVDNADGGVIDDTTYKVDSGAFVRIDGSPGPVPAGDLILL